MEETDNMSRQYRLDVTTRLVCEAAVSCVALSADNTRVATGMRGGILIFHLDSAQGAPTATAGAITERLGILEHGDDWINKLFFRSGDTQLVSCGDDGAIRLWDLGTLKCIRTMGAPDGRCARVIVITPLCNEAYLASDGEFNVIKIWDVDRGTKVMDLHGHADRVSALEPAASGGGWNTRLFSGSCDNTIKLWDITLPEGKELIRTYNGHYGKVYALAVTPDGKLLMSGGEDYTIRIWDAATGETRQILRSHRDEINCLAIHADGVLMLSAGDDYAVCAWNLHDQLTGLRINQRGLATQRLVKHKNQVMWVCISPDGRYAASAGIDKTVLLWTIQEHQ